MSSDPNLFATSDRDELNDVNAPTPWVCRLSPRSFDTKNDRPRGTLIDPSVSTDAISHVSEYKSYYNATVKKGKLDQHILVEFGQPPTKNGKLLVKEGDLVILLVGSDNPDGSDNKRGILGLAKVEQLHLDPTGSVQSWRCALEAEVIYQLPSLLTVEKIRESNYFEESLIADIGVFGINSAPQAHNFVRFFKKGDQQELINQRIQGLLGLFKELEPDLKKVLSKSSMPELVYFVPNAPRITLNNSSLSSSTDLEIGIALALASKPFVILTGASGTGKSRTAIRLAGALDYKAELQKEWREAIDQPYACMAFVPVESDWTDQRDMLGYRNPFGSLRKDLRTGNNTNLTYEITNTLRLLLRASHPDYSIYPHFLILDEMNLSHVERYFSSFLSLIEADRTFERDRPKLVNNDDLHLIAEVLSHERYNSMELDSAQKLLELGIGLTLPYNLHIIGTVNVDETTYMFSPKVLDRAFVIELPPIHPSEYLN